MAKPFKVVVTRLVSEHQTEKEARAALAKLKPEKGALGVVIESPATTSFTRQKTSGPKVEKTTPAAKTKGKKR